MGHKKVKFAREEAKMGKYQSCLEAVETEMKNAVDALYAVYVEKLEANRQLLPDLKARRDHEATAEYRRESDAAKARAVEKETALFADLRRDVESALTAAPSPENLAYLQALSLRPCLTESDIRTAAIAVRGNAVAEANVAALAKREGVVSTDISAPPALQETLRLVDEFETLRAASVQNYLSVQQDGDNGVGLHAMVFTPGCGWSRAMEEAEGAIERYGN